jgi:hypothetical protein
VHSCAHLQAPGPKHSRVSPLWHTTSVPLKSSLQPPATLSVKAAKNPKVIAVERDARERAADTTDFSEERFESMIDVQAYTSSLHHNVGASERRTP